VTFFCIQKKVFPCTSIFLKNKEQIIVKIQSLSVVVPSTHCINDGRFCVSKMHNETTDDNISGDSKGRGRRGYESKENYTYFEGLEHTNAYIKPANHEQKKRKKYRTDPGRRENMTYDAEKDEYTCMQGKRLKLAEVKKTQIEDRLSI